MESTSKPSPALTQLRTGRTDRTSPSSHIWLLSWQPRAGMQVPSKLRGTSGTPAETRLLRRLQRGVRGLIRRGR